MQSFGRIVKKILFEIADGNSDAIRIFSFLKDALSFDHIFSIGFRSGLYGANTDGLLLSLSSSCFTAFCMMGTHIIHNDNVLLLKASAATLFSGTLQTALQ